MFKQFLDLTAKIFSLTGDVQQTKADIRKLEEGNRELRREFADLQHEVREIARGLERLAYEIRRVSDTEAHECKIMALQPENDMLKFERCLPLPKEPKEAKN